MPQRPTSFHTSQRYPKLVSPDSSPKPVKKQYSSFRDSLKSIAVIKEELHASLFQLFDETTQE
jgi:hypothetical protein